MERLFKYSSKTYSDKKCLGTRTILGELEEKQESGKVFTKLHLGEYTWQTYNDVATQAENLGKGLRELGLAPKDKVDNFFCKVIMKEENLKCRWCSMQTQELSG